MSSPNPFAEGAEKSNPYAAPQALESAAAPGNRLFVPALLLLVGAIFWELYVLAAVAMVFSPSGPFSGMDDFLQATAFIGYVLMLVVNAIIIAGAVAMLRLRPKWLAWTACILGLVPMFGTCMGLTIPLAIWCLVLLRRPEVDAGFSSAAADRAASR